ncbi:MAG TPA: response regulator [Rhodocyclaceae bacterium]|nr:response regulator [Rhodocyclaceae bacterium]
MSLFKRLWSTAGTSEAEAKSPAPAEGAPEATWPIRERRLRKRINAKHGLSALIIDDSPTIVAALGKTLRSAGYVTIAAGDAESGLTLAQQTRPSLIFLDIVLPGMNGFAALRLLRKDPQLRDTPVIMISGNEHATEQFYANRIGADDFMKKPFARIEIFSRIENLLDGELIPRRRSISASLQGAASAIVTDPLPPALPPSAELSAAASMLAARKELTAMGLKYFEQAEYDAAVRRNDQLAVALFVRAGAIKPGTGQGAAAVDLASLSVRGQQPN